MSGALATRSTCTLCATGPAGLSTFRSRRITDGTQRDEEHSPYCTAGTFLLGRIVQRAVRQPVDEYVNRRLLDPLVALREWSRSPSGEVMTGGRLRLRSRDLAKLGLLVLSNGRWGSRQIIPADWIAEMLTVRRRIDAEQSYGFLYWQRQYVLSPCGPITGWYMSGNGGNVVVHITSQALVVVVTRRHYNQRGMHEQRVRLLKDHGFAALSCTRPAG
jgi:CubicO group peptidase (beta-lactamase class C family)